MEETRTARREKREKKPGRVKKEKKPVTERNRLHYVTMRLAEIKAERSKLVEERKELLAKRRAAGGIGKGRKVEDAA